METAIPPERGIGPWGSRVRRAIATVAMLALTGYGATSCRSATRSDTGSPAPSAQPDLNATIRVAAIEDGWTVIGTGARATHFMYVINQNVYEPLIYLGSDYSLKPGLATSWQLQPDNKTWRFNLRRGVTFHDGTPFTADDVVWTWGPRQAEGRSLATVANTLHPTGQATPRAEAVKKIDDFTVDFNPIEPNFRLPEQIVHSNGAIVKNGTHNDTPPYAGTGPYRYVSYVEKQTAAFERNDSYWGEKPKVKRIEIQFIPDPVARVNALRSGQVDLVYDLPADATKSLENDSNFKVVRSAPGRNHLLYSNILPGRITAEKAVREAVTYSLDRGAYVNVVLEGNGEPGRWMAPRAVLGPAAEGVAPITRDVMRAERVLEDAGWRKGSDGIRVKGDRRLTVKLLGQPELPESALLVIQSNLRDTGIETEIIKTPDIASRIQRYSSGRGDFDLDLEPPSQTDANPAFLPVLRMSNKVTSNLQFAPGGRFEELVDQAAAAKATPEVQQLAADMMRILINEEYVVVPLAGTFRIYGMAKNVSFSDPHPSFNNQTWFSLAMTAR